MPRPSRRAGAVLWLVLTRGAKTLVELAGPGGRRRRDVGYFDLIRVDGTTGALVADELAGPRRLKTIPGREKRRAADPPHGDPPLRSQRSGLPQRLDPVPRAAATAIYATSASAVTGRPPIGPSSRRAKVWRRLVGPGWSSFAVVGDRVFTQEQRGEDEAVVCIDLATGQEIWSHEDKTRFWEVVAGAGPRPRPRFTAEICTPSAAAASSTASMRPPAS